MSGMSDYTITNLEDVEDMAAKHGVGESASVRFPREDVEAISTGFAHVQINPGKRHPFPHRHDAAEEVYVVLAGSGRVKFEDTFHDLRTHDIVRVSPHVTRGFEAGPEGLELIAFGTRHAGDGEIVSDFWEK
jgi:mannose-6-phosphate isomerase-like protein (cupin superfamily)